MKKENIIFTCFYPHNTRHLCTSQPPPPPLLSLMILEVLWLFFSRRHSTTPCNNIIRNLLSALLVNETKNRIIFEIKEDDIHYKGCCTNTYCRASKTSSESHSNAQKINTNLDGMNSKLRFPMTFSMYHIRSVLLVFM